jgi:hypothetical protein
MRALLKIGFGAAFAAILVFGNVSISTAQPADEVSELNKKVTELSVVPDGMQTLFQ